MSKRLVTALLAVGATLGLLALPAAAQYAGTATLTSSSGSVCTPGGAVTLTVEGAVPGTDVTFIFRSSPVVLGVVTADANGVAVLAGTWPVNAADGSHTVIARGLDGRPEGGPTPLDLSISVVCAPAGAASLPRTGADSLPWFRLGAVLVALGGIILLSSRKRYAVVRERV